MAQYGEDICGETGKHITSVVDAAMDLYNLYIIAADMQEENIGDHTFDFDQYFADVPAGDGDVFAWILDMEDFYEKGPSYAGQDETYRIAQPLLDDFFNSIDKRVAGGTTAATFRFAHAETIMPFAALIGAPGSTQQAPAVADPQTDADVYNYQNNEWRGESVTPMAANIQWDVATRDGIDPKTGKAYTPLIRMLYNEKEVAFGGTNDYGHGDAPMGKFEDRTEETFYGACHALMAYLSVTFAGKPVIFMTPLHRTGEDGKVVNGIKTERRLKDYVDAEKRVAEYYAIPVLDLFAESGMQPNLERHAELFFVDGLHPNDAGYARIAEKLGKYLENF